MRRHLVSLAVLAATFGLFAQCASASTTGVLLPTSDGNYLQWTPSSGTTHYTLVDESACNGTTDYNATGTTGNRDSYGVNLASVGDGAVISQVDVVPCASRNSNGSGSATLDVLYRFNGTNSSDSGSYALSGTTPTQLATTTFASLSLFKTSTSTLEIGTVLSAGTKGARVSRLATTLTYSLSVPSAPTNLVVTNSSSSVNNLSWTDNSSNELGFRIYRSLNGGAYLQIATTTLNSVSYSDTGLAADQTYSYRVAAYNSAGEAAPSIIAFDSATSSLSDSAVSSVTFSLMVNPTGTNRILFVGIETWTDSITSVTFNGSAMTLIDKETESYNDSYAYLYYLVAPATGTHDVVVTASNANHFIGATAVSYTGASQTGVPDATAKSNSNGALTTDYSQALTTAADYSWVVLMSDNSQGRAIGAGSDSTLRGTTLGGGGAFVDSNGPVSPVGSRTLTVAGTLTSCWSVVTASFKPAA